MSDAARIVFGAGSAVVAARKSCATRGGLTVAILGLSLSSVFAETFPLADHVVKKIGQEIEFQDEVKAVSFSRSTQGYYLSFGAAYPAQTLSVWVREEMYDRLPARGALVGRTVRIKGQLESSPAGPLLKLEAPEQFRLLQTQETVLAKPVLDGKKDRDQFKAAVWQNFSREEFDTLEVLAEELRQSRERFSDGTWILDAFFDAFDLQVKASSARALALEEKLSNWERARPGSHVLLLVRADYHRDLAWRSRATVFAPTSNPEGWEGFKRELSIARQILQSSPGAKIYPKYFTLMQSIALSQRWPKEEYFRLFAEAISLERDCYKCYFNAAEYLLPRWGGKKGEWEEFAEQQRQQRGAGGEGDALYARIGWAMKDHYRNLFRDTAVSWEVMASGFEYLIKQYPESRYLKNAYANFAWRASDRARLRKSLPDIGAEPDMTIWVNLENVGLAKKFAENDR